jgi:hypothetical protein
MVQISVTMSDGRHGLEAALEAVTGWSSRGHAAPPTEAWLEDFSPDMYLPMLRLAEPGDAGFLDARGDPGTALRYRSLQRQMMREYLSGLARDFHRLHALAAEAGTPSQMDEKMEFVFCVWSIELRLTLNQITRCAANLEALLASVEQLTIRVRELAQRRHMLRGATTA